MDLDQVAHDTIHCNAMSIKAIAEGIGTGYQVLLSKANVDSDTHKLTLREAMSICKVTGDSSIIECMLAKFRTSQKTAVKAAPVEALALVMSEVGDVSKEIARLAKGDLTPKQRAAALREIAEAKKALDDAADLFIEQD